MLSVRNHAAAVTTDSFLGDRRDRRRPLRRHGARGGRPPGSKCPPSSSKGCLTHDFRYPVKAYVMDKSTDVRPGSDQSPRSLRQSERTGNTERSGRTIAVGTFGSLLNSFADYAAAHAGLDCGERLQQEAVRVLDTDQTRPVISAPTRRLSTRRPTRRRLGKIVYRTVVGLGAIVCLTGSCLLMVEAGLRITSILNRLISVA